VNLATVQFHSQALRRQVTYTVILPERQQGPAPVLMQLHGYSDDHTAWVTYSNLVRHAKPYPFIIVLPDGGVSFYANIHHTARYEEFLMEDLWAHVGGTFQVKPGPWAIGGLSMGGLGALRLALKYPGRFASAWAHSGFYPLPEEMPPGLDEPAEIDVGALAEQLVATPPAARPVISFDCGTEDALLPMNRRLHASLERLGIAHEYAEYPGAHTWDYWDQHVQTALQQHARVFGVSPA
jgi:putative tributyrin esterase